MADQDGAVQLDLSDVAWRLGQKVGGGQLWEPCNKTDIQRWVMALDYVNPLHWDQRFASQTKVTSSRPSPLRWRSTTAMETTRPASAVSTVST
jgi:acyl dehydratase